MCATVPNSMKIYSWNMLYRNRELDRAFDFIAQSDFDIFCLQEVPEDFLTRLKSLPSAIAFHVDTEKVFSTGVVPMYHVILSKHPLGAHGALPFIRPKQSVSLRARLFTMLMRPFHFAFVQNRNGLYADVVLNGKTVRIFSLHLALTHPEERYREFEYAMTEHDPSHPAIVCGDFNILEKPHITPLNWLLGGNMHDVFFYKRERLHIEKKFAEHSLRNPLRGEVTHSLSRSQLDHILVSDSFSVQKASVLMDAYGSDHQPIRVEIS